MLVRFLADWMIKVNINFDTVSLLKSKVYLFFVKTNFTFVLLLMIACVVAFNSIQRIARLQRFYYYKNSL